MAFHIILELFVGEVYSYISEVVVHFMINKYLSELCLTKCKVNTQNDGLIKRYLELTIQPFISKSKL